MISMLYDMTAGLSVFPHHPVFLSRQSMPYIQHPPTLFPPFFPEILGAKQQPFPDLFIGKRRILFPQQGGSAADRRDGHGGAAFDGIWV